MSLAQFADEHLGTVDEIVGSADATAVHGLNGRGGLCAELVIDSPLPTYPPLPTPSAGPVPPGSLADQAAAALRVLGLRSAVGVELTAPGRVRWLPAGSLAITGMSLTNHTSSSVAYATELSVARWDGSAWQPMPCIGEDGTATSHGSLCAVQSTNAYLLPAGATLTEGQGLFFFWPGTTEVPPATYALVLPLWPSADDMPVTLPTEAAVAIIAITPGL